MLPHTLSCEQNGMVIDASETDRDVEVPSSLANLVQLSADIGDACKPVLHVIESQMDIFNDDDYDSESDSFALETPSRTNCFRCSQ